MPSSHLLSAAINGSSPGHRSAGQPEPNDLRPSVTASLEMSGTPTAATLAVTYATASGPRIILTRRPASLRRHPGQISFPGGMIEPSDPTPWAAALREAKEEIGLRLPADVTGIALTPVVVRSSGVMIQPFWVRAPTSPRLRPSAEEVEAVLRIPVASLRAPGTYQLIQHPRWPSERTPAYVWRGHTIWGATAQTLAEIIRMTDHP